MKLATKGEYYQLTGITFQELETLKMILEDRNDRLESVGKEIELSDLQDQITKEIQLISQTI